LRGGVTGGELIEHLKALRGEPGMDREIIESVLSSRLGWHSPERLVRWAELDRFAAWLMENVRDEAIDASDRYVDGRMAVPGPWAAFAGDERLKAIIPQIVDGVLFRLVHYAENGSDLGWRRQDGTWVSFDDLGGGEMGGWLATDDEDGWRARFSRQRPFVVDEIRASPRVERCARRGARARSHQETSRHGLGGSCGIAAR
jgi:hypothetical protein